MISRPDPREHHPYYGTYIAEAGEEDPVATMRAQLESTCALLGAVSEEKAGHRYAPDKWSVRQVVGHLADAERIFSYRALRFARGDTTPLPGFDENEYVATANFDTRTLESLVSEWRDVRRSSIALFAGLAPETVTRQGIASNGPMSVRALAYIIPGHVNHHVAVLRSRYGIGS